MINEDLEHGSPSSGLAKGWVHPSGKLYVWNQVSPYHVQYIVQNPRKYRLKEQDIMDHLIARYEDYGVNQPVTSAERVMGELKSGRQDIDRRIEYMVVKKGWCRFVINGDWNDIRGRKFKDLHKCAKILHDKMPQRFIKGSITTVVVLDQEDGEYNYRNNVELELDQFKSWVGGNKPDPKDVRVRKHTEVGKTMQMFRGHDWDEPAKIYNSWQPPSFKEWLNEARRFTPSGTFQFPSANQAKDFMSDISREGRGNIQTQHRFEQGYGRKNIIDVKWSGTMDRVVYDVLRKHNGYAWTQSVNESKSLGDRSKMFRSGKYKLTTSMLKRGQKVFVPVDEYGDDHREGKIERLDNWHNVRKQRYIVKVGGKKIEVRPDDVFIKK